MTVEDMRAAWEMWRAKTVPHLRNSYGEQARQKELLQAAHADGMLRGHELKREGA